VVEEKKPKKYMENLKTEISYMSKTMREFPHLLKVLSKRKRAEGLEKMVKDMKAGGVTEENIKIFQELMSIMIEIYDDEKITRQVDGIITGGLIAISLIILQALISLGKLDTPSTVSVVALSISIPLCACFLFIRFVQSAYRINIHEWNIIIGTLTFGSYVIGFIGITAAIWHAYALAGIIFLIVSISAFVFSMVYYLFASVRSTYMKRKAATQDNGEQPDSDIGTEAKSDPKEDM